MDALRKIEDKWKVSTKEAILLLVCTAVLVIGLCTGTALKMRARRKKLVTQELGSIQSKHTKWSEPKSSWGSIKRVLMGSVRWSGASKWEESNVASWRETPQPLLAARGHEADLRWQSHNSVSPVWQRPILMGEKCELPRFSGLILYDEQGQPLHSDKGSPHQVSISRLTLCKTSCRIKILANSTVS
ncbi:hypothetical protein L1049_000470 [Liquidambar formosana]|uniref:Uncharacterized protein n=1 Tax=Liquidambar formosana TaxID=63359 RepID=A0AAP0R5A9_LIQFO